MASRSSFGKRSFEQWQEVRGQDKHSRIADPLFVDPEHGNFALKPGSPALAIGFQRIDVSRVGPRQKVGIPAAGPKLARLSAVNGLEAPPP
jgi:hypothetical protein